MRQITFEMSAFEDFLEWGKVDIKVHERIVDLVHHQFYIDASGVAELILPTPCVLS